MKLKLLKVISVSTMLFSGISIASPTVTSNVKAAPGFNSNYWLAPHHVYTTRNVKASLLKGDFLTTRHFIRKYKTIPKGTPMIINRGGSSFATWVIHNKSLPGLGKIEKPNGDTWVIRINNNKWFKTGFPPASFKGYKFTNGDAEVEISQIKSVFVTDQDDPRNDGDVLGLIGKFTNKSGKAMKPYDFMENHFDFYAVIDGKKRHFEFDGGGMDNFTDADEAYNTYNPVNLGQSKLFEWDGNSRKNITSIVIVANDHGKKVGTLTIPIYTEKYVG